MIDEAQAQLRSSATSHNAQRGKIAQPVILKSDIVSLSKSKQKYSFGKSARFEAVKKAQTDYRYTI